MRQQISFEASQLLELSCFAVLICLCSRADTLLASQSPVTNSLVATNREQNLGTVVADKAPPEFLAPSNIFVTGFEDRPYTALQIATNSIESKPCEMDPDGHWGEDVFGFRIGLRLSKRAFTNGEPVEAIVLLRNVSGRSRFFPVPHGEPTGFQAIYNGKKVLRSEPGGRPPINARQWAMWAQSQKRFVVRLDQRLDMSKPGKYIVWAQLETKYPSSGPPWAVAQIFSAAVEIEVLAGNGDGD